MNPELPTPQSSSERALVERNQGGEYNQQPYTPERAAERPIEQDRAGQAIEREAQLAPPQILPMPQPQTMPVPMPVAPPSDDANPVVASDDDLIEKEWVDKAKKIIAETRDDPYRREQEVSKLQADYLRKRYGREIGISS